MPLPTPAVVKSGNAETKGARAVGELTLQNKSVSGQDFNMALPCNLAYRVQNVKTVFAKTLMFCP